MNKNRFLNAVLRIMCSLRPSFRGALCGAISSAAVFGSIARSLGQIPGPYTPNDGTPTEITDVSTVITTGCGYDAWTGSARRTMHELAASGTVGTHGLSFDRTYSSSLTYLWTWSFTWRMYRRPYVTEDSYLVVFPDGRQSIFAPPRPSQTGETGYRAALGTKERVFATNPGGATGTADLWLEDGSKVHFTRISELSGNDRYIIDYFTPVSLTDPYGQVTTLNYTQYGIERDYIHLTSVIDPSGRSLTYTYDSLTQELTQVTASTGVSVTYTWTDVDFGSDYGTRRELTHVAYSDGTVADYTYVLAPTKISDGGGGYLLGNLPKLQTAQDTRAEGPMRSIRYEYTNDPKAKFPGQISSEGYIGDSTIKVSSFSPDDARTHATETRGDGPSRTLILQKINNVPLLKQKPDYLGFAELFDYDSNNFLRTFTDRNQNITSYLNEPILGRPQIITHPAGTFADGVSFGQSTEVYEYSDNLNPYFVKSVTDDNQHKKTYVRDLITHRITEIDYPDNAIETFAYNSLGEVTRHKRKNGYYEWADYDGTGLLTTLWNPTLSSIHPSTGPNTAYTYYPAGHAWQDRVQTVTDPRGFHTTYEYDLSFATSQPCSGRGLVTKISYPDDTHGGTVSGGTSQSFTYSVYGNKLSETNEKLETTTHGYDNYNRLASLALPGQAATTYDYTASSGTSPYSHTTKSIHLETSPSSVATLRLYDNNFRLTALTEGYNSDVSATTSFAYDNNGNQKAIVDPRGTGAMWTTNIIYDQRNRKTAMVSPPAPTAPEATSWEYDSEDNVTKIIRPDNTQETKTYDPMNRVWSDTLPKNASPPSTVTTAFAYYPAGTLKTVTDGRGQVTTFFYDGFDLKNQMSYPKLANQTSADYQTWAYDQNRNLLNRRTAANVYQVFTYDERNRKASMGWHTNTDPNSADLTWANGVYHNIYTYDLAGRPFTADNAVSTVTRTYDAAGRLLTDGEVYKDATFAVPPLSYTRRDDGKVTELYVGLDQTFDFIFGYDGMARLSTLQYILDMSTDYQYGYDLASNVVSRSTYLNGTNVIYTVDNLNRITERDINLPGANWSREHYSFDMMNRVTDVTRDEDAKRDHFDYDQMGELTAAQYGLAPLPNAPADRTVSYTWDKAGNRTNVTDSAVGSKNYVPNNLNQYKNVAGVVVSNGPSHEIAAYAGVGYSYIGDSYLAQATAGADSYTLYYDALGRCVKRTSLVSAVSATHYYLFDGEHWVLEYDTAGVSTFNQLCGLGVDEIVGQCMRVDGVWQPRWPFPDRNGNTSVVTGTGGVIMESYRYDAFGAPSFFGADGASITASNIDWRFLFTGREWNPEYAFYEYRARAYSPSLGRFTTEDPKGFDAGDYNLYRYVSNDPLDKTDPTGLLVDAYVNYSQSLITIIDRNTGQSVAFRGGAGAEGKNEAGIPYRNNPNLEGKHDLGPAPRGNYEILNRLPTKELSLLNGKHAYALEAKDGKRDDMEKNTGRTAFRFHEGPSAGCVTTCDSKGFEKAVQILDATKKESVTDANGLRRTVFGEFHVFSGKETPAVVLPGELPQARSQ